MKHETIITATRQWLETVVVGLNLCPFAKRELDNGRIRFFVSDAETEEHLLDTLQNELELLSNDKTIETTLLIHPNALADFYDYNAFLRYCDGLLEQMKLDGVYQIASFHPEYQFSGTEPDDVENYTNRSPYPVLHILREDSLSQAIADYPDTDQIPDKNISRLNKLGHKKARDLLQACFPAVKK